MSLVGSFLDNLSVHHPQFFCGCLFRSKAEVVLYFEEASRDAAKKELEYLEMTLFGSHMNSCVALAVLLQHVGEENHLSKELFECLDRVVSCSNVENGFVLEVAKVEIVTRLREVLGDHGLVVLGQGKVERQVAHVIGGVRPRTDLIHD